MTTGTVSAPPSGDPSEKQSTHTWEDTSGGHIWEHAVKEDAQGNIIVDEGDTLAQAIRKRRKRLEQNDYSQRNRRVVRDMIRYLYILVDASRWMRTKDPVLQPGTRIDVTVAMLQDFVQEYYDQNPLSHLGFVLIKNGEAEILTQLSSSSKTHKLALESLGQLAASEPPTAGGEFSLQNGLEVAGRSLGHQPRHGSREIVVLTAALSTCDPGYILTETLPKLTQAKIRVSCFALSAEMHICRKLADETTGAMGVCLDKAHFRDWMMGQCVPPPAYRDRVEFSCEMVKMGFPPRSSVDVPTIVHATREKSLLARTAYTCPQCQAKNSELPTDCAVCGLKLVLAPHLARSFHHLFPVAPFVEVGLDASILQAQQAKVVPVVSSSSGIVKPSTTTTDEIDSTLVISSEDDDKCCYACLRTLGASADSTAAGDELMRFQCPDCKNIYCVDCDSLLHQSLHNCPGCLSR
jgi:transcription initiation factor TFIIH subunit 2